VTTTQATAARRRVPGKAGVAGVAGVRPPRPLLSPEAERRLTRRQREILDELESFAVEAGLGELTMAQLAARMTRMTCSLRTLYGLAPSKDELVLTVLDRRLHRVGRIAMKAIEPQMNPLEALRAYLQAVTIAVAPTTEAFARELAALRGAGRLADEHESYIMAVTRSLLDRAVEESQIPPVDTAALAHVLGGLGRELSRPEVIPLIEASPKQAADTIVEIVLRGLETA